MHGLLLVGLCLCGSIGPAGPGDGEPVPGTAFRQYEVTDELGRTVSFFLSEAEERPLPLLVFIQGSGGQPLFVHHEPSGRIVGQCGQGPIARAARGKARVLLVEKPGSEHLAAYERPGSAESASELFRREHTLPRWSVAVRAAIAAARRMPGVSSERLCVAGHSEGGLVACHVAARMPEVTHVASLAGGGVTQLFDLAQLAREGHMYRHVSEDDPDARVAALLRQYRAVLADPDSADAMFLGHPHRRWSSFLVTSPIQELRNTRARVFIAQGVADTATSVASFDALQMELMALGRDVTARRVADGDHGFAVPGGSRGDGWTGMWVEVLDWYAASVGASGSGVTTRPARP